MTEMFGRPSLRLGVCVVGDGDDAGSGRCVVRGRFPAARWGSNFECCRNPQANFHRAGRFVSES